MEGKKKITLPMKVFLVGCILGLIFVGIGGVRQIQANKTNEDRKKAALKASEEAVKKANARLKEIEAEYNTLKSEYDAKSKECDSIEMTLGSDWFNKSSKCVSEKSEISSKMSSLEMEDSKIKSKDYTVYYSEVKPMTYLVFYIIGASVAGIALLAAFIIYLVKGKKTY